jgi:DNA invertase Pin-like site-specific DNA recombinase
MSALIEAVILARVSGKEQESSGYSLDSQVKLMQGYNEHKDMVTAKVFRIAESASKSEQRKIFKSAMNFIEDNGIKHLIVEKVDRHVRNFHDAVETHDWLMADEQRCVHFVKDSLVLHKNSRSQEWLNWGIRVVMAKNYIDNLREESMKGSAEKLAQGWLPGVPPPGYKTITENGKRIHVPDEQTSKLMLKAFKFYLKPGESIESTAKYMADLGIVTRPGNPYVKSHLQRVLTNPFYIGINRIKGKEYRGVQQTFIPKPLFKRVQEKMHGGRPQAYKKHHSPLKGIIRCEDCGSIVTWQLQKGHYYGVCRRLTNECKQGKMLREDYVEELVLGRLKKLVCPSQKIIDWVAKTMREQYKDQIAERDRKTATLQAQIKRVDLMDETLYDDKLSGEISKDRYDEKHTQLMSQKARIQDELLAMEAPESLRLEHSLTILELSQKAADLYAKKTAEQKRLIISKLFEKLSLKGGSVSVKYSKFAEAIAEKVQKTHDLMEG